VSSVSNGVYFLTVPLVSVMRVIYTSKGMSKYLGCALYMRCALSIEKYVILKVTQCFLQKNIIFLPVFETMFIRFTEVLKSNDKPHCCFSHESVLYEFYILD
jgi:hypothetical protein